ncbi:copper-binding protein [Herbaspirillum sp. HC18]|nr:copper-binding protein [Herbaspirillum sp. HC18]
MKRLSVLAFSLILGATVAPIIASAAGDHGGSHAGHGQMDPGMGMPVAATSKTGNMAMSEGEIKKIDKEAGKLTIKHGELRNLDMPSMTMVFQVKDQAMLDQVKAGDKVNFVADKFDGKLTVTQIESRK